MSHVGWLAATLNPLALVGIASSWRKTGDDLGVVGICSYVLRKSSQCVSVTILVSHPVWCHFSIPLFLTSGALSVPCFVRGRGGRNIRSSGSKKKGAIYRKLGLIKSGQGCNSPKGISQVQTSPLEVHQVHLQPEVEPRIWSSAGQVSQHTREALKCALISGQSFVQFIVRVQGPVLTE